MPPFDPRATIDELRKRGLHGAADQMAFLFGAWERTMSAYVVALPFLSTRDQLQLHVVNATAFEYWGTKIIGGPMRDDAKVLREHEADTAYHKYGPEAREGVPFDIKGGTNMTDQYLPMIVEEARKLTELKIEQKVTTVLRPKIDDKIRKAAEMGFTEVNQAFDGLSMSASEQKVLIKSLEDTGFKYVYHPVSDPNDQRECDNHQISWK